MKVLFIGGTGTISTACSRLCAEQGMDLWVLLRGTRDNRLPRKASVLHGDIKQQPAYVRSLLDSHSWDCVVDWVAFDEGDVLRDIEFFGGNTKQYIFVSSTAVYEKPLPSPHIDEMTPIGNRFWDYAEGKARCERALMKEAESSGFPVVIVRPGHTYAEYTLPSGFAGMGFKVVDRILEGKPVLVHGDGTGLWTVTYNEDFAKGFIPLIGLDSATGETFQITSDELIPWTRLYDLIGQAVEREVNYAYASSRLIEKFDSELGATLLGDKAHTYIFDNSKIKSYVPGFSATTSFAQGVRHCIDWYTHHREEVRFNPRMARLMDDIIAAVNSLSASGEEPVVQAD